MKYGLIGEHLGHSFSKEIHESIADYKYELCEIEPDKLGEFFESSDICGINVTIPYKERVIPYLDFVSESALKIGAVNTVKNENGRLCGYNTDYMGMKALILRNNIDLKGKKALVLGNGGTSKTGQTVLADLGVRELIVVGRPQENPDVTYDEVAKMHSDADFILNTTPVGMYPKNEGKIIDLGDFPNLIGVIDVVYNPLRTNLVLDARRRGISAEGGLYMLVAQAVYACEIFTGKEIGEDVCVSTFNKIFKDKENIVLVGMPSSGKSTVGAQLARMTGRTLIDTDDLVVEKLGMPISEFLKTHPESEFRDVESEAVKEAASKNGVIIATGGGAILRNENVTYLKQNSRLYFLNRSLEKLIPTADRPLSSSIEALKQRYDERYGKYIACADVTVDGDGTPEEVAEIIKGEFFK